MRKAFPHLWIALLFLGCARAPLKIVRETAFPSPFLFSQFQKRVVTDSGLVSDGQSLYFGTLEGKLYALNAATGGKRWEKSLSGAVTTLPAPAGDLLFVGTSEGSFYALSSKDGAEKWRFDVPGEILGQPVQAGDALVLFGVNDATLYAVDVATGKLVWKYRRNLAERITVRGFAAPAARGNDVFAAFSDGTFVALARADGTEKWKQSLPSQVRFPDVVAPIRLDDGKLVASQFAGGLFTADEKGRILFSLPSGGSGAAPLSWEDRWLIPAGENRLLAVNPDTGKEIWSLNLPGVATWSGLTVFKGKVLAATYEGKLYVVDPKTGKLLWTHDFGEPLQPSPIVQGDRVWILTRGARLFALQ